MNTYTVKFFAACPNNGLRIEYTLQITTVAVIMVEDILATVADIPQGYHESIADTIVQKLGGKQILKAHHHGVDIVTVRGAA